MAALAARHPPESDSRRNSDELLFIGQRCSHDACSLVDFLPLKCQYCKQPFCSTHFPLSTHSCPQAPPSYTLDRIAPLCPLCNTPISTLPGEDPNLPMERHISLQCVGVDGKKLEMKRKRENGEICWRRGCGKVLFAKIRCDACKHDFCPTHRYPNSHACPSLSSSSPNASASSSRAATPQPASSSSSTSKLFKSVLPSGTISQSTSGSSPSTTSAARNDRSSSSASSTRLDANVDPRIAALPPGPRRDAALAALKRSAASSIASSTSTSSSSTKQSVQKALHIPTTTDKRSKAELQSMFEGLKKRNEKGLLSETEKVRYAELVAEREKARRLGKDKDCVMA